MYTLLGSNCAFLLLQICTNPLALFTASLPLFLIAYTYYRVDLLDLFNFMMYLNENQCGQNGNNLTPALLGKCDNKILKYTAGHIQVEKFKVHLLGFQKLMAVTSLG